MLRILQHRAVRAALSYGVAAACLYWVFHDIRLVDLVRSLAAVHWWFAPAAVLCDLLVYAIAAWEWQILLRPVGRVPWIRTAQAVFAGRFANDVLPVHVGYVIRVFLLSRWAPATVAAIAPSLLVERLFDGFWIALGIGLTAGFFPLPGRIAHVADVWAGIVVFGLIGGSIVVLRKTGPRRARPRGIFRWPWFRKVRKLGDRVLKEVRAIGRSSVVLAGFGLSFVKFATQAIAFLFVLWAYGFHFPIWTQLAVFLVAYVGLSLPSTPASAGVFQLFCVAGLEMVRVPKPAATGFALLAFVILTVPLSVAGFFALAQTGLSLHQVRRQAATGKLLG